MKRNSISRTSKFSLLIFGTGLGLVSLASSAYAQTSIEAPAQRGFQDAEISDRNPLDAISTIGRSAWPKISRVPADQEERAIAVKSTVEGAELKKNKSSASILVDPTVFEQYSRDRANVRQSDVREIETPADYKFPARANPLNGSSLKPANHQNELVQARDDFWTPLKPLPNVSHASRPAASNTDRFARMQISGTPKPLGRFATAAIPTSIPTSFANAQRTSWESSNAMVQPTPIPTPTAIPTPIAIVKEPARVSSGRMLQPTQIPTSIAKPTNREFINKMLQPLPPSIPTPMAIAKRANWSPSSHLMQPIPAAKASANPIDVSATDTAPVSRQLIVDEQIEQPKFDLESGLPPAPVSVFIEGPDYLKVNQSGDYEIAVVNSSSEMTYVSSICLRIPKTAEIQVIGQEARIDDLERTLTWSIAKLASGQQQKIHFRVKVLAAGEVDFPVTVSQDGRDPQTISQTTYVQ